jgi:hypothetical protein
MEYIFQFLMASDGAHEQLLHQVVEELPAAGVEDRAIKLLCNFKIPSGLVANRVVVRHHSPSSKVPNPASNVVFSCDIEDLD